MAFFGIPLSGMIASQDQLSSVSNNLANLDTVGFKDQTVSFSDLFAQSSSTNGAGNPIQSGLGVSTSQTNSDFTDGGISNTGIDSNMALSGNGFFITQASPGVQNYTRAGNFTVSPDGFLTSPTGEQVLGYGATKGVVTTTGALQPLQVALGSVIPATATSNFQITANLNANAPGGSTFASTSPVFDSLGAEHYLNVTYTKSTTLPNTWSYAVTMPTADLAATVPPTTTPNTTLSSGTLSFDSSGNLLPPLTPVPIVIPGFADGGGAGTETAGVFNNSLNWNLTDANGNGTITQTDLASTTAYTQDGQGAGTLSKFTVEADGTIQGTYSNGQTNLLGQVAIASFANTQGLLRTGNNNYQATPGSGGAEIGTAETGGRGAITGDSVEASNVDVAAEFAKLIVAQQAYSANAKTITTFQQVSQATIAMIQ